MPTANILIVEDELIVAKDLEQMVKGLGYGVAAVASSAEDAIRRAGETQPDVVLMDIKLEGSIDGVAAAEQIRDRFRIPVVYVTAYVDENTLQRAKLTEPFGYIVKPVQDSELHAAVELALYERRMQRELEQSQRRLSTLLKSIGDGVIATDHEERVSFMNPIAEELTGWKQEEAWGHRLSDVCKIIHEGTGGTVEELAARVLTEEESLDLVNHSLVAKNGAATPVQVRVTPIKDEKRRITGVVLVFRDVSGQKQEEALRSALYRITRETVRAQDMEQLYAAIHRIVGELMYAENFYIALHDPSAPVLRFPYFVDEVDTPPGERELRKGFTEYVLRTGQPLLTSPESIQDLVRQGEVEIIGVPAVQWLGVPLKTRERTIGVLAVQSYREEIRFGEREKEVLTFVSQHIAGALERKRVEQQLRLQASALASAANTIIITDREGCIVWVNPAFTRLTGYTTEEAVGQTPRLLKSGRQDQAFYKDLWDTILSGHVWQGEIINRRRDGTLYSEDMTITPVRDRYGDISHFIGIKQDITERKQSESDLARLQEQMGQLLGEVEVDRIYEGILDAARIIVQSDLATLPVLSEDGGELRYLAAQGEGAEVIRGRILPMTTPSLCSTAIRERAPVRTDNLMNDPRVSRELAEELGMTTGLSVPLIRQGRPLGVLTLLRREGEFTDEKGRLLAIFANYAAGLIEAVHLYERVRRAETRYRDLYDNGPDGYASLDATGMVEEMNATMLNWLGTEREDAVGRVHFEDFLSPEGAQQFQSLVHRCQCGELQRLELELVPRDGTRLPVRLNVLVLCDSNGQYQGCRVTARDIRKEKELEAQLLQSQKLESLGTLVGGIAHDFNNVLTGILGFAQLIRRDPEVGEKVSERLQRIELLGERAADMIKQLMAFSRKDVSEKTALALHPFLKEFAKLLNHMIPEDIEIELKLASMDLMVEADPTQLQQVVMNLAVNARDAMPKGGRLGMATALVELDETTCQAHSGLQPGPYARVSVSDTGIGIPEEIRSRIFDPFFTTKEVGKGTGLGLPMVYGIVKGHGGAIELESQEGKGTTFQVYFPLAAGTVREAPSRSIEVMGGTETILLVEDEPIVLEYGQMALEEFGYRVLTARDGVEALGVYQAHRDEIALLILDMIMPEMGGVELFRQLKRLNPAVKVLMVTGYADAAGAVEDLIEEGIRGFLRKPYQVTEFAEAVRRALGPPS